jgi:hypothetical protein
MLDKGYRTTPVLSNWFPTNVYRKYLFLIKEFFELIVAEKLPFHDFPETAFAVHPQRVYKAARIVMHFFFSNIPQAVPI